MIVTVEAALEAWPSFAVSENVKAVLAVTVGAVNVGRTAVALERATAGPAVCDQA